MLKDTKHGIYSEKKISLLTHGHILVFIIKFNNRQQVLWECMIIVRQSIIYNFDVIQIPAFQLTKIYFRLLFMVKEFIYGLGILVNPLKTIWLIFVLFSLLSYTTNDLANTYCHPFFSAFVYSLTL